MKKLLKLLLILLISGAVGTFVYWGGKKGVALFRAAKESRKAVIAKKTGPVARKTDTEKSLPGQEKPAVEEKNDYTFFETLNDPEMKKIVGLNNQIQDEPIIPPQSSRSDNKAVKKATPAIHEKQDAPPTETKSVVSQVVQEGRPAETPSDATKENVKKDSAGPRGVTQIPRVSEAAEGKDDDKTYTVQISSFKELSRAQALQTQLQKKGYPAYLLTVDTQSGVVYRVFLGKYIGQGKAKAAANKVKREDKIDAVVVLLSE